MSINQDAFIYAGILDSGDTFNHSLEGNRGAWIQVVHGSVQIKGDSGKETLEQGDGAGITGWDEVNITANEESELILFDVAMEFETPYEL